MCLCVRCHICMLQRLIMKACELVFTDAHLQVLSRNPRFLGCLFGLVSHTFSLFCCCFVSLDDAFLIPEEIVARALVERIRKRHSEVTSALYRVLVDQCHLELHLKALRGFFLMECGDVMSRFTRVLFDEVESTWCVLDPVIVCVCVCVCACVRCSASESVFSFRRCVVFVFV